MIGFSGGAIGADPYCDRSGIHCRTIADCAKVLDALKDQDEGYYDPRDIFSTVPRSTVLSTPYASHATGKGGRGELKGVRLGIIRESMLVPPGSMTEVPIVTAATHEIKSILGEHLGATLLESTHPLWIPDPEIETMKTDFRRALARLVPVLMPDLLFRLDRNGQPLFKEFAAAVVPTEFAVGKVFGSGTMKPIDYCVALAEERVAPPNNLDLATIQQQELAMTFRFHIHQYLGRRAADWKERGFTETLVDFAALNARSKYWGDDQRAAFKNWEEVVDPRNPLVGRQGVDERVMLRELLRRTDMMVILENKLDALVRLHTPWPPGLIGHPYQYDIPSNLAPESLTGPNAGLTEMLIPAGYVTTVYDPVFGLNSDGTRYVSKASHEPTTISEPGLPFSLVFRGELGRDDILLKVASSYEAASRRRIPPPDFGPLPEKIANGE